MRSIPLSSRRARAGLLGLAVAGMALIPLSASQGADPFVAGGRATRPLAIDDGTVSRAIVRAAAAATALQLPAGRRVVRRVDDRYERRVFDEVTTFDAADRPVAIQRLDRDGRLIMAVSLGWRDATTTRLATDVARQRATAFARSAGADIDGASEIRSVASSGGWVMRWPRVVDGVPVRDDGISVSLWADGSLHSYNRSERPLAGAPSSTLDQAAATRLAAAFVAGHFSPELRSALRLGQPQLAWISPNDTWNPERADAPEATARLAWVVQGRTTGQQAQRLRAIEVWFDAGTGAILGGDVLE